MPNGTFVERPRCQCTLGGALTTISAIRGAAAIVHAAPGCAASADAAASQGAGYWGTTASNGRATPSTNLQEREIVFGGEDRLREQIETTKEIVDADLFAVITGCMTDIIGDDVKAVVGQARGGNKSLIVAETGGFKGTSLDGYDLIWRALVDQYVEPSKEKDEKLVNLFGVVPSQDVFWRGNLLELKRLLESLGLSVNTFLTPFDDLSRLKKSSEAALNIVLSDVTGVKVAERFEKLHSTPWIVTPIPFGPTATVEFLQLVGEKLRVEKEVVDRLNQQENEYYYAFVERFADLYNDQDFQRNAVVVGTAANAYPLTRFVAEDLNWIPFAVAITDILNEEQKQRVERRFDELPAEVRPRVLFETDTSRVQQRVLELVGAQDAPYGDAIAPAFVLGSTLDRPLAADLRAGFWSVSYPVVNRIVTDQGYVGFRGGLRLATELLSVLVSNR